APDPSLALCDDATEKLSRHALPDCIIALGGGSNIDLAKVLSLTLVGRAPSLSYVGVPVLPHDPLPLIAIPTTAGTASEITPGAILVAKNGGAKVAIMDNKLRAFIAVVDPNLTLTCPPRVTADAGIDALTHAIESFMTQDSNHFDCEGQVDPGYSGRNSLTRMFAKTSIELCFEHLVTAYLQPDNLVARSGMALASLYAGMSYGNAGLNAVHALAYGVSALTHETHGTTNAVMLPYVMADLVHERCEDLCEIARMAGVYQSAEINESGALSAARYVKELIASIGLADNLEKLGVKREEAEEIALAGYEIQRLTKAYPGADARSRYSSIVSAAYDGLQCGIEIQDLRIRYQIHGNINSNKDNVILFPTWFAGTHSAVAWLIGRGKALGTDRFCVVVIDALGNGESSSPSNHSALIKDGEPVLISLYDEVRAQHSLVEELAIRQLHAVVGRSMGAQAVFQWLCLYPGMVKMGVAFCGAPKTPAQTKLVLRALDTVLRQGLSDNHLVQALTTAAQVYAPWTLSYAFCDSINSVEESKDAEAWTNTHISSNFAKFHPADLLSLVRTWYNADISLNPVFACDLARALKAIKSPVL
ncbi:hypothetical protein Q9L58_010738, partial [Maublancomyces gigas]